MCIVIDDIGVNGIVAVKSASAVTATSDYHTSFKFYCILHIMVSIPSTHSHFSMSKNLLAVIGLH